MALGLSCKCGLVEVVSYKASLEGGVDSFSESESTHESIQKNRRRESVTAGENGGMVCRESPRLVFLPAQCFPQKASVEGELVPCFWRFCVLVATVRLLHFTVSLTRVPPYSGGWNGRPLCEVGVGRSWPAQGYLRRLLQWQKQEMMRNWCEVTTEGWLLGDKGWWDLKVWPLALGSGLRVKMDGMSPSLTPLCCCAVHYPVVSSWEEGGARWAAQAWGSTWRTWWWTGDEWVQWADHLCDHAWWEILTIDLRAFENISLLVPWERRLEKSQLMAGRLRLSVTLQMVHLLSIQRVMEGKPRRMLGDWTLVGNRVMSHIPLMQVCEKVG